ncbi:NADP-dependent oxidoreductase [Saccharothrix violaceirubra]|uniref:Enoyl reductase (ER) domain-containing protein n=1 Tax=Saccharothrix violaceirubra TaxID=413306 RepID=A0A7W7T8U0_9PSEU|nr:NADP-dependent oxidoreductase [Saccharothrix violaceirubra]MBB4968669.1 hypothetical protein [Saccharothrix violaceirubra]
MSAPTTAREFRLASRPTGYPTREDFTLAEVAVPEPGPGQILVRNRYLSVDPYMRGRMNAGESYIAPFEVGEPLEGGAVGEVVASGSDEFAVGDAVWHFLGWREYALVDASAAQRLDAPSSHYLGILGMPGLTAYVGLVGIAPVRAGDTVFVSGAAGAVGAAAGQIARRLGAGRVVGSAGSPEKVRLLVEEFGFDAAFDYHDGDLAGQLREAAPDGVDVYFDNVGGEHLEAALEVANAHARFALCGWISGYNTEPVGVRNLGLVVGKRVTLRGYLVRDHEEEYGEAFRRDVSAWLSDGGLKYRETITDGFENTPGAFIGLLRGENVGKAVVAL